MSLTRDEWEETWEIVEFLEYRSRHIPGRERQQQVEKAIARLKQMIQSVIGQMEPS